MYHERSRTTSKEERAALMLYQVDTACKLDGARFKNIALGQANHTNEHFAPSGSIGTDESTLLRQFQHFTAPTLSHLLALVIHFSTSLQSENLSLLVIDSVSFLFQLAYLNSVKQGAKGAQAKSNADTIQWATNRRTAVMDTLVCTLEKFAAARDLAVLLISQTTTRVREEERAMLHPSISASVWDRAICSRIVFFRDWIYDSSQKRFEAGSRAAGVIKSNGRSFEGTGRVCVFKILSVSCHDPDLSI